MNSLTKYFIVCTICLGHLTGCNKRAYLNQNPASDLQVPENLEDLQSLLDNSFVLNEAPGMGDASSDNYYLPYSAWITLSAKDRNTYIWARDIYMGAIDIPDWNKPFEQVFYCNVVLKALDKINKNAVNERKWNHIKGTALFLRSFAFYNLAQLFALPYDNQTAATDMGLPLRLNENILDKSVRSSVQQTYDQVISDLTEAKSLLSTEREILHLNRPGKPAAFALLSRIYLGMRQYQMAGAYADSCLALHRTLLNYNSADTASVFPFTTDNPEIIFYGQASGHNNLYALVSRGTIIDSVLYRSYDFNDLRRTLYYNIESNGAPIIRSSYTGKIFPFSGLAVDEIFFIRAECLARAGKMAEALDDLNRVLVNRYRKSTFIPLSGSTVTEVVNLVLLERRKELPFRNTRWTDLRRLNKEGYNIGLTRNINGEKFELAPNHIRYALPIPPDVIALSGMTQNPR